MKTPDRRLWSRRWLNDQKEAHRSSGPAIEWDDGSKEWWIKGICMYSEQLFGNEWERIPIRWYLTKEFKFPGYSKEFKSRKSTRFPYAGVRFWGDASDRYHRLAGPAMEYDNGTKKWYYNGLLQYADSNDGHCVPINWYKDRSKIKFPGYEVEA